MAKGLNRIQLIGNTGRDPERRAMKNGGAVTTVSLATSETWRDKKTGDQQERTEWHQVVFFGALADIVADNVKKGERLYVEGSVRTREYEDKSGTTQRTFEVVAKDILMLSSQPRQEKAVTERAVDAKNRPSPIEELPEDDIPF